MTQINYIQLTLRSMGVAHCDIKPDNIIVTNSQEGVKLHLIDMDDAVLFGQRREIGTYFVNMLGYYDNLGETTSENTDDLGFYFVKNFILLP
jgi:serine/threonine protein kinase